MSDPNYWRKVTLNNEAEAITFKHRAQFRYECDPTVTEVAVFKGMDFPEDDHRAIPVIYFSPTAALICESDIKASGLKAEDSDTPSRNEPGLKLLYCPGDCEAAWGLLK